MYDFLVVGAGFSGATFARVATDLGKSCMVVDKLPHVAGAAHDVYQDGIFVSQYGAHIFHTDSEVAWEFVRRFGRWYPFVNKPKARVGDRIYSFPINLMTLHQVWGVTTPMEAMDKLRSVQIPCQNPRNFEEWALSRIGRELYELFIYGYTKKQYFCEPSTLPASIIRRLPIRLTFDENYFCTKYQAMPVHGFTNIVREMLTGVKVELNTECPEGWRKYAKHLVWTGTIDSLMKETFGPLRYLSMRFEHVALMGDFQGNAVVNHCSADVPYLRTVEHRHFHRDLRKHHEHVPTVSTVVSYDYPTLNGPPYYPIRDEEGSELYFKYFKACPSDVTVLGRLGEYKYYDIDQAIASAMMKARKLCS